MCLAFSNSYGTWLSFLVYLTLFFVVESFVHYIFVTIFKIECNLNY